jgi:hypothetical protein
VRSPIIFAGLTLWATLAGVPAQALAQAPPPRLTIAFGAGPVRPLAMEARLTASTWTIQVQAHATKHLFMGAVFSSWQHALAPEPIAQGNPLVVVLADTNGQIAMRSLGFSALATAPVGRLRLSSGAVVGYTRVSARTGGALQSDELHVGGFSVAGLLGIDVRLSRHLEAFAMYSLTLPATPGFATVSLVGGLRVSVH